MYERGQLNCYPMICDRHKSIERVTIITGVRYLLYLYEF